MSEKYLILRDRMALPTPGNWNLITQTSPRSREIHGDILESEYNIWHQGRLQGIFVTDQWERLGDHIAHRLFHESEYFERLLEGIRQEEEKIHTCCTRAKMISFDTQSFEELVDFAHEIKHRWLAYDAYNVPPWFIGGDTYKAMVKKLFPLSEHEYDFLVTPATKTFASQYEQVFPHYLHQVKTNSMPIEHAAEELSEKFGWLPFGYDGPEYWHPADMEKKIQEDKRSVEELCKELRMIQEDEEKQYTRRMQLLDIHTVSPEHKRHIDQVHTLTLWTDERKMLEFKLHYWYSQVLYELEKRYNISYTHLKHLLASELEEIDADPQRIRARAEKRVNEKVVAYAQNGEIKILEGDPKRIFLQELQYQLDRQVQVKKITGTVASKGPRNTYQGVAKIVLTPQEANEKIVEGDFIVTSMTTPDYIASMNHATGFITDEGGVTCHAAIVGREMNKPCIIATRNATRILQDGDTIEVNVEDGTIKKITS